MFNLNIMIDEDGGTYLEYGDRSPQPGDTIVHPTTRKIIGTLETIGVGFVTYETLRGIFKIRSKPRPKPIKEGDILKDSSGNTIGVAVVEPRGGKIFRFFGDDYGQSSSMDMKPYPTELLRLVHSDNRGPVKPGDEIHCITKVARIDDTSIVLERDISSIGIEFSRNLVVGDLLKFGDGDWRVVEVSLDHTYLLEYHDGKESQMSIHRRMTNPSILKNLMISTDIHPVSSAKN